MEAALNGMDDPSVSQETFNELDTQFHVAVAEAGGNRLVAGMTIAIRASMHAPILRAYAELGDWQSLANRLRSEHRATLDAIRRRDSVAAPDLIGEHIRSAYQSLPALHG